MASCGRLSWLLVSFWVDVKHLHIISSATLLFILNHVVLYMMQICRFNVQCPLAISTMLSDELNGMRKAPAGTLFGAVTLQALLNDDTDGGQLILTSSSSVLLTLSDLASVEKPRVYEADILSAVKQKDAVYITLHETVVNELGLSSGMTVNVEIQFQLNRSNFVRMHEAVDAVRSSNNLPLLFPVSPASGQPDRKHLRYVSSSAVV